MQLQPEYNSVHKEVCEGEPAGRWWGYDTSCMKHYLIINRPFRQTIASRVIRTKLKRKTWPVQSVSKETLEPWLHGSSISFQFSPDYPWCNGLSKRSLFRGNCFLTSFTTFLKSSNLTADIFLLIHFHAATIQTARAA